jgi:hypothetical protein
MVKIMNIWHLVGNVQHLHHASTSRMLPSGTSYEIRSSRFTNLISSPRAMSTGMTDPRE